MARCILDMKVEAPANSVPKGDSTEPWGIAEMTIIWKMVVCENKQ